MSSGLAASALLSSTYSAWLLTRDAAFEQPEAIGIDALFEKTWDGVATVRWARIASRAGGTAVARCAAGALVVGFGVALVESLGASVTPALAVPLAAALIAMTHIGALPRLRRRAEINAFRAFLRACPTKDRYDKSGAQIAFYARGASWSDHDLERVTHRNYPAGTPWTRGGW